MTKSKSSVSLSGSNSSVKVPLLAAIQENQVELDSESPLNPRQEPLASSGSLPAPIT